MSYDQIPNLPQIISLSSDTLLEGAQAGSSGKLSIGQIVSFANAQASIYTDQLLLEELGVVGNGTGDQSSAIVAALIYANGKKLVGTPGSTYRITNTIEYTGTYNIDWAGSSIVCDADVIAMDINSGISGVYYLSDDYSVGTTDLPMAETGIDIVQGRKIKIISDAIDPSNRDSGSSSSQYRLTEWFVSGPGSTQTNIVLQSPLSDTIGINPVSVPGEESRVQAYTTALNARLIVLPESVSFSDSNMKLSYSSGKTWNKTAVFVRGFDNPIFNNISINNSYDSGLAISGCYNPVINNPKTTNIIQYGIAFSGSFGGMVTNPYVENSRHGITTSSSKATASSTNMNTLLAVGRNPNTFISGGYGGGNPGFAPFDTHHDAKDFVFSNQHTKDTGGFAMQARGTGHKFLSPIVRNSEYGLLALTEYGSGDPDDDYFTAGKLPGDVTNLQIDSPDIEVDSQAVVANTAYLFLSGVGLYSSVDPRVIWSNGSKIVISGDHNFVVDAGNAISGQGLIEVNAVNPRMTTAIDIAEVVIDGSVTIDARFATGGVVEGISADAGTRVVINGTLTLMMPSDSGNLFAGSGEIVTRNAGIVRYSKEGGPDSGQALNITGRNIRCEAIDGTSSSRMIANVPFSSRSAAQAASIPLVQQVIAYQTGYKVLQFKRDATGTALTTADGAKWSPLNENTIDPDSFPGTDSQRVQAALDLQQTVGNGADVVVSRIYDLGETVTISTGARVVGRQGGGFRRPDLSAGYDLFNLGTQGDQIEFCDLPFDGNRDGQATEDHLGSVILLNGSSTGDVAANTRFAFRNCKMFNTSRGAMGLHVLGFKGVDIKDSWFEDCGGGTHYHPIYLRRVGAVEVSGNTFFNNEYHAIKIQPIGLLDRIIVSNNIIDVAERGIYLPDCGNVTVTGNTITNIGGSTSNDGAIVVTVDQAADDRNIVITGNTIDRSGSNGIRVSGTRGSVVTGNVIANCALASVSVRSSRDAIVASNMIRFDDLDDLVPDGLGGFVAASALTPRGVEVVSGPLSPQVIVEGNCWQNLTAATVTGIWTDATGGYVNIGPMETQNMSGVATPLSEATAGVISCVIAPTTIKPLGQLIGTGSGMTVTTQTGTDWLLRSDSFAGQGNNIRLRAGANSGSWLFISSGDNAAQVFGVNAYTMRMMIGGDLQVINAAGGMGVALMSAGGLRFGAAGGPIIDGGSGSPEGVKTAPPGSLWLRTDTGQLYSKTTGTGNAGWVAITVP